MNFNVVTYLLRQDHDTEKLISDLSFVFNLMLVGKSNMDSNDERNPTIEDFVFLSKAPCYTAARLSFIYREMALKEKDRAADLNQAGDFCEDLSKDLVAIAANMESPATILNALDPKSQIFIDTLIENEQKNVISQYVVQQYLQEIWKGHLRLSGWQFMAFFASFVFVPPVWLFFSTPVKKGFNKVPVVKFMSYLTAHLYFMALLILVSVIPPDPTTRSSLVPFWYEIILWIWYLGLGLSQITNPGAKGGLSWVKYLLVALGLCSGLIHSVAIIFDPSTWSLIMYIRNIFYGLSLLFATILILDFLSFHPLFGPWAIIISELIMDVGKFVVVLSLFISGYSLLVTALNQPFGTKDDYVDILKSDDSRTLDEIFRSTNENIQPFIMFELLFFALFGLSKPEDFMMSKFIQGWTIYIFKLLFASYLLLTVVVLINLLIAMMSDTYQRIQQQSDIEWKYGLAKLIRNMERTQVAPSPLNLLTTWIVLLHSW